jgi:hypothetical protein
LGNLLVKLNHVTPKEWMDLMGESIQEAQAFGDPDTGEIYYQHWCRSLEKFCFKSGLSDPLQHQELLKLWRAAIINTPHGVPLTIDNAVVIPSKPVHPHVHAPAHGQSIHSANLDHDEHLHSHDRPSVPPPTYYELIAIQILGPQSS